MNQIATSTSSTSTNAPLENLVAAIFAKMQLDYGKKFTDQWGATNPDALNAHWVSELTGYTPREIKRGLAEMDHKDWPPTLPEFKKMCRAPLNDMATYYEAISGLEARGKGEMGVWSHPAVYWAASFLRVDLMSQTHAQMKDRWAAALKAQMERSEWAEIPAARVLLPMPDTSPAAKKLAAKMMQDLGAAGVIKKAKDNVDHKLWAKTIMARHARGDKTLSMIQLQFARTALEIEATA